MGSKAFAGSHQDSRLIHVMRLLSRETGFYIGDGPDEFAAIGAASANISACRSFGRDKEGRPQIARNRYGYHIEHQRLREFLEKACQQRGVSIRDGRIADVFRGEMGIEAIRLDDGRTIRADLYIDASGAPSLLLGQALGTPWCSFSPSLLCDSAIIAFCRERRDSCQYRGAGWIAAGAGAPSMHRSSPVDMHFPRLIRLREAEKAAGDLSAPPAG